MSFVASCPSLVSAAAYKSVMCC